MDGVCMRKLIECAFVSLDGVVESAEAWALPYFFNEENKKSALSRLMECDVFLLGRLTFELLKKSAAASAGGDPYYDRLNSMPKFVASTSTGYAPDDATVLSVSIAEEVTRLKNQPGKGIMKYGNGSLDAALVEHSLIDELHLSVIPVVVGKGRRLFEGIDPSHLKMRLVDTTRFQSGIVTLSYAWVK